MSEQSVARRVLVGLESFAFGSIIFDNTAANGLVDESQDYRQDIADTQSDIHTLVEAYHVANSEARPTIDGQITLQKDALANVKSNAPEHYGKGFEASLLIGCVAVGYAASRALNGTVKFVHSRLSDKRSRRHEEAPTEDCEQDN